MCGSGDAYLRLRSRDPEIPCNGELRSSADRVSVERYDYRYLQLHHHFVKLVQEVAHPRPFRVFEAGVRAGAERSWGGGAQNDGPRINIIESFEQSVHEWGVEGVQLFRPVEPETQNVPLRSVGQQHFCTVHRVMPSARR